MSVLSRQQVTSAALRGLALDPDRREEKLFNAHPEVRKAIEAEIDAIQWVAACFLIWNEQEQAEEVISYIREYLGAMVDVGEEE